MNCDRMINHMIRVFDQAIKDKKSIVYNIIRLTGTRDIDLIDSTFLKKVKDNLTGYEIEEENGIERVRITLHLQHIHHTNKDIIELYPSRVLWDTCESNGVSWAIAELDKRKYKQRMFGLYSSDYVEAQEVISVDYPEENIL